MKFVNAPARATPLGPNITEITFPEIKPVPILTQVVKAEKKAVENKFKVPYL
jgi:hypothetical protein